ncbi:lysosomal alpha-mannosidase [Anoplophora glabripennis]|uniref:lysosomal alpha-mannosidase n=1 Tax=Anoplophora glabripennis TaxID=217634 RepID=UPI000874EC86|nr:lysosomal alpha-mannosidase [Anoplophora glabripennis]
MIFVLFSILIISIGVKSANLGRNIETSSETLGCLNCYSTDEGKINVHLVPHSHDDVGWLKTVDQYFYGLKPDIHRASVQNIINSVVEALLENSNRRFVQVETAFFWKWWTTQNDDMKLKFKYLVDNGQIEMVNGAWSMNDEACTNYQSTIDQFTWGLRTINDTIGLCGIPRIGWQIDPFGHSREQASIFAQLGYDGVFFSRLDHADREKRNSEGNLNFAWQGSANLDDSVIFGGIFPFDGYSAPPGFCWDYKCNDDPVYADTESPEYNIDKLVANFVNITKTYAQYYPSNHILIAMGEDFYYEAAHKNFINMDRFIKAFQGNPEIHVLYSTPSCYIKAVNDVKPELKLKTDDFFPYSDKKHSFWTGYFTSRPNSKRFERVGHNILQATKQLVALNGLEGSDYNNNVKSLEKLRDIMGIMQHHDAITGTERQLVTNDYVKQLTRAIEEAEAPIGNIIGELLKLNQNETLDLNLNISSCLLTNVSICSISQSSENFLVVAYNPLAWTITHYIRLPVPNATYKVEGPDGEENYDIVSPISYFKTNMSKQSSESEIVFPAKDIPPLGIKMFYVSKTGDASKHEIYPALSEDDNFFFGDEDVGFQIDNETNLLKSVTMNGISVDITQNFYYYKSETGQFDESNAASGAYIFRPTKLSPDPLVGKVINAGIIRTTNIEEFHQKWSDNKVNVSQIIRVYKSEKYIEFDWLVGGINVLDERGREVISKYTAPEFENYNIFYTDSNGREMIRRELNIRSDYTYNATEDPVASNYYPVTSRILIKDENRDVEIALLTDRSQGGSSMENGQIELMIHRRIMHDDHKGLVESLNEMEFGSGVYVRGSHYLIIGSAAKSNPDGKTSAAQQRILAQKKLVQPWIGVGNVDSVSLDTIKQKLKLSYTALSKSLPENINILTYEPWKNDTYLLRFEHILEQQDDSVLSNVTTVEVNNLFNKFKIKEMTETTLGANELLEDYKQRSKYVWNTVGEKMHVIFPVNDSSEGKISLTPMQIRTFVVKVAMSSNLSHKASSILVSVTLSLSLILLYLLK